MKILHVISGSINSGASKGALQLHKNLIKLGIDSKVLTDDQFNKKKNIYSTTIFFFNKIAKLIRIIIEKFPKLFFYRRLPSSFSNGLIGYNFINHKFYKSADIIHLHWVSNAYLNLSKLEDINKPIVWTLRDMWLLTGGCHYTLGCYKYKNTCKKCPQLSSNLSYDLSTFNQNRKIKYLKKSFYFVAVSKWLLNLAKKSKTLKNKNITQINNIIDSDNFYYDKKKINYSKKINITFGSENLNSLYKGFKFFLDAIKYLDNTRYEVNIFGKLWNFDALDGLGINYNYLGYINSESELRKIYSKTDIFIACSIQDAFPKTFIEAMLCNTAIVCFKDTTQEEFVRHKVDGYCAKHSSATDLADGIKWLSANAKRLKKIKNSAENYANHIIDNKKSTLKYIKLYKSILG